MKNKKILGSQTGSVYREHQRRKKSCKKNHKVYHYCCLSQENYFINKNEYKILLIP